MIISNDGHIYFSLGKLSLSDFKRNKEKINTCSFFHYNFENK